MDFETLLLHYFGTADLDTLDTERIDAGREKLGIDFGIEREPGRRFALWTLMDAFGFAPAPVDAFEDPALRHAAENYLAAVQRMRRD